MAMQMAGLGLTTKCVDETTFGEAASVALHTSPRPEPSYYLAATRRLKELVEMLETKTGGDDEVASTSGIPNRF